MIIKTTRVKVSSGPQPLWRHVTDASQNDDIRIHRGTEADLHDMFADARRAGVTYGCRHVAVNSYVGEPFSADTAHAFARNYAKEFCSDPAGYILIEHHKPRAQPAGSGQHFHLILPEYNPVTQCVMDARNIAPRNEFLARAIELKSGLKPTRGRHNRSVYRRFLAHGEVGLADGVAPLTHGRPALAPYGGRAIQRAQRSAWRLSDAKDRVQAAWHRAAALADFWDLLAEDHLSLCQDGYDWLVYDPASGVKIGEVSYLLRSSNQDGQQQVTPSDVRAFLGEDARKEVRDAVSAQEPHTDPAVRGSVSRSLAIDPGTVGLHYPADGRDSGPGRRHQLSGEETAGDGRVPRPRRAPSVRDRPSPERTRGSDATSRVEEKRLERALRRLLVRRQIAYRQTPLPALAAPHRPATTGVTAEEGNDRQAPAADEAWGRFARALRGLRLKARVANARKQPAPGVGSPGWSP